MSIEDLYVIVSIAITVGLALFAALNSAGWTRAFMSLVTVVGIMSMVIWIFVAVVTYR